MDFPGGSDGKVPVYNGGDLGSIPGLGRSPGEGIYIYIWLPYIFMASQVAQVVKNLPANAGDLRVTGPVPGLGRSPQRRAWQPTPVLLDRGACLAGYSPHICFYAIQ